MRALVWFRDDLRVRDHTALADACARADRGVVGLFAVTPEQWRDRHRWGDPKTDFTLRSAHALSHTLGTLNIALRVIHAPTYDDLPGLILQTARELRCDALYFNREYELNELDRDESVTELMVHHGIDVFSLTDHTLFEPGEIRTQDGRWYTVFTPFKKALLRRLDEIAPPAPPPRAQPEMVGAPDPVPVPDEPFRPDLWPAGEDAAAERLSAFTRRRLSRYHTHRDTPSVPGTSQLSPYLATGVLSPRQCLAAVPPPNRRGPGADQWLSELLWREFYKHVVVGFPRVVRGRVFQEKTASIRWDQNPEHLAAWQEGRTGFPIVDAAMRQLVQTGWMHNRLRMITAMFLSKDLFLDWRLGESFFARHLVDFDFASNNGGWQWSASTGTDAAPYFRIFNPASQSARHDPDGRFIKRFVPELAHLPAKLIHAPPPVDGYPPPIVDHRASRERAIGAFRALAPAPPERERS